MYGWSRRARMCCSLASHEALGGDILRARRLQRHCTHEKAPRGARLAPALDGGASLLQQGGTATCRRSPSTLSAMSQTVPLEPVPRTRSRLASDRSAPLLATIDAANPLPRKEVDDSDGRASILQ